MNARHQLKRIPLMGAILAWLAALKDLRSTKQLTHRLEAEWVTQAQKTQDALKALNQVTMAVAEQQSRMNEAVAEQLGRIHALESMLQALRGEINARHAEALQRESLPPEVYLALEERLRGGKTDVLEKLGVYSGFAQQVRPLGLPAADLGCGRGELLQIFERAQLPAAGIDASPAMIQECAARVLTALQDDALAWLERQPDASLSLVSAIHMVEHLPPGSLWHLLTQAHRVIAPGGLLILETPNPENLQVSGYSFWLDPTHRAPIPPPLLENLTQLAGFQTQEILRLSPYSAPEAAPSSQTEQHIQKLLYCAQDYALVCFRPPST